MSEVERTETKIDVDIGRLRREGIFLMVPMYAGMCFGSFTKSCMGLQEICHMYNIPFKTWFLYNESLIPRGRNYCVDEFLRSKFILQHEDGRQEEKFFQHAIFIDSDIDFNPTDVIVLAHLQNANPEYDIICAPYTKKVIAYEKLKMAVDQGFADANPNNLEDFVGDFVFNVDAGTHIRMDTPFQVKESGTGFMMINRDVLLGITEKNPQILYYPNHSRSEAFNGTRMISAFFDCGIDPDDKQYLSEDYYFCRLAKKSGYKIWMVPYMRLGHSGFMTWRPRLDAIAAINAKMSG